jgi:ketosteroid isomerase-like protein
MKQRILVAIAALPLTLGAQDTTAAKASLLNADRAAASGRVALALSAAPQATVLLPARGILRGAPAYRQPLTEFLSRARGTTAWTAAHAVVSRDGTLGCTTGVLHLSAPDSTAPTTGRYVACWRHARAGGWVMVALSVATAPAQVKSLPDSIGAAPASGGTAAPRRVRAAQAMADADRAFARFSADSGGPAGAFSRWIADDGMMLGARAVPVRGPEQAKQAFASFPKTGRFEWAPIDSLSVASRDRSLGFTVGEARVAATPSAVTYSKYLTVWRREPDGRYKFIFDIGSDRPAPAAK